MKTNKYYLMSVIILVILVVIALGLRHKRQLALEQALTPQHSPWAVSTAKVRQGDATQGFPAVALVKGMNDVAITPRLNGLVLKINVREGSFVTKGQLLAVIDTQELTQQLNSLIANKKSAQADATRKQRDALRASELLKSNGISQSQAEQLKASAQSAIERVKSLANQIEAAKTHINYAQIVAPFSGYISARLVDPGDFATIGKPLFRLISNKGSRVVLRLPANILEKVNNNTQVELSHNQQHLTFVIDRIFPSVDARALGYIEIDVGDKPFGLSPGALIHARIITHKISHAMLIPYDSKLPQNLVYKVVKGKISAVPVDVLLNAKEGIAVTSPQLKVGDTIVVAHETQLLKMHNGDAIITMETAL